MTSKLLLATRDAHLARTLPRHLVARGFDVDVAHTGLELVFALSKPPSSRSYPFGVVVDARRTSLGRDPLSWLRAEPCSSVIAAIVDADDFAALEAAELCNAACVVDTGVARVIAREVAHAFRGKNPRDALRFTPPRAPRTTTASTPALGSIIDRRTR